jgi:uncharacterized protein (TIGR03790 family)
MKYRVLLFWLTVAFVLACGLEEVSGQTNYDDVLLIVNTNSPISEQVGQYFARARAIPTANIARIAVSTEEEIDNLEFESLRAQVENHIVSQGLTDRINYIVTTKGVPLKVNRGDTFSKDSPSSSVESELTLILGSYSNSIGGNGLVYSPYYYQTAHFSRAAYGIYLVTRLDGYSFDEIKGLIDRGGPDCPFSMSTSKFVFDEDPDWNSQLPGLNTSMASAQTILASRGLSTVLDQSTMYLTDQSNVIGYTSWGSNDHYADEYTQYAKPHNVWVPGAIAETYVSTDGRTFTSPPSYGQSLVADLIEEGITGVKGYVYEPYSFAMAAVSVLFDRYTNGYNLAESYYMSSRSLSWMDEVVGDPKTGVYATQTPLSIELSVLTVQMRGNSAELRWSTVSETNNYGFYIQRKANSDADYMSIPGAFVPGHGTTLEPHSYSFEDVSVPPGKVSYRLKQIDFDGTNAYHGPVEVVNTSSVNCSGVERTILEQNYPNPFNPSTTISFALPTDAKVKLEVYNVLGQRVAILLDKSLQAGYYAVNFDAGGLASGLYFCRLQKDEATFIRKMLLTR